MDAITVLVRVHNYFFVFNALYSTYLSVAFGCATISLAQTNIMHMDILFILM